MPDRLTLDPPSPHEMDLIIFAPQGRDAQVLCDMLVQRERGLRCVPVRSLHAVCDRIASGAGAILLTSEAITEDSTVELNASLAQQPPWSDVPIILLTHANRNGERTAPTSVAAVEALKEHANIMVVERPSQVLTMVLTVRAALRARRRQYAVRGYLSEIQSSELQLRIALRAGRMGTWDMDLINSRLVWSDGMFTILGLEPHACAPTIDLWRDHVHPDDLDRSINEFQRAKDSGSELVSEQRLVTPDGRVKWVETRARFTYDSSGNAIRATGVAIDVDQRKRSEEQLRASQQSAEAANLAKDRFLAVLSHELRTPLTPVLAMVQMLQEDPGIPADVRGPLDMIRRNMELEARLIDDLLDLTRIVRGKFELQHAHIDLHETIKSAMAICRHDSAQKRLKISTSLKASRHTIHGDSTRLQQVFWNLLKNAVKFTPEGGEIRVETQDGADGGVVVAVSDTGVGIPPALLPNIFNAFEQGGREMTRAFGGLGLGLTISKAIVEAHGGSLAASSEGAGKGARFAATFPAGTIETFERLPAAPDGRKADDVTGCKILLVEDHPDTGRVMRKLLIDLGHDVVLADSIAAARHAYGEQAFDLVVSDLGLPDGSGVDLIKQIRSHRVTPAIALSGFGMMEDVERSKAAGFSEHLTKPVNILQLKMAINRIARVGGTPREPAA